MNNNITLRKIHRNNTGLAAYVIGPEVAKKALQDLSSYHMVDAAFWHLPWLDSFQVEPAPAVQLMYIKEITTDSYVNKSWLKRKFIRLKLTLISLPSSISGVFFGEKRFLMYDKNELAARFSQVKSKFNNLI